MEEQVGWWGWMRFGGVREVTIREVGWLELVGMEEQGGEVGLERVPEVVTWPKETQGEYWGDGSKCLGVWVMLRFRRIGKQSSKIYEARLLFSKSVDLK